MRGNVDGDNADFQIIKAEIIFESDVGQGDRVIAVGKLYRYLAVELIGGFFGFGLIGGALVCRLFLTGFDYIFK